MPLEAIVLIAAIIVSWLVFTALVKILQTTLKSAFTIAAIVLVLQLLFGIGPERIWQQIVKLPESVLNLGNK
jgi:succinate-acetate transporter protein